MIVLPESERTGLITDISVYCPFCNKNVSVFCRHGMDWCRHCGLKLLDHSSHIAKGSDANLLVTAKGEPYCAKCDDWHNGACK